MGEDAYAYKPVVYDEVAELLDWPPEIYSAPILPDRHYYLSFAVDGGFNNVRSALTFTLWLAHLTHRTVVIEDAHWDRINDVLPLSDLSHAFSIRKESEIHVPTHTPALKWTPLRFDLDKHVIYLRRYPPGSTGDVLSKGLAAFGMYAWFLQDEIQNTASARYLRQPYYWAHPRHLFHLPASVTTSILALQRDTLHFRASLLRRFVLPIFQTLRRGTPCSYVAVHMREGDFNGGSHAPFLPNITDLARDIASVTHPEELVYIGTPLSNTTDRLHAQTLAGAHRVNLLRELLWAEYQIKTFVFTDVRSAIKDESAHVAADDWSPVVDQAIMMHARIFFPQPGSTASDAVLLTRQARAIAQFSPLTPVRSDRISFPTITPTPAQVASELERWDRAMIGVRSGLELGAPTHGLSVISSPEYDI
jgi:hypothetical protein